MRPCKIFCFISSAHANQLTVAMLETDDFFSVANENATNSTPRAAAAGNSCAVAGQVCSRVISVTIYAPSGEVHLITLILLYIPFFILLTCTISLFFSPAFFYHSYHLYYFIIPVTSGLFYNISFICKFFYAINMIAYFEWSFLFSLISHHIFIYK